MVMDMDVLAEGTSEPTSRVSSPPPFFSREVTNGQSPPENAIEEEVEPVKVEPQPRKMGNLMKELKQDVQQGGMEFNMDNFF